eukprot:403347249
MDCILNLQIPKSTDSVFIIRPSGKTFITGVASSYSHKYNPKILKNYIYEEEFISMIQTLNETLFSYWPCPLCFCIGYILCPCSFGFSFMMPQQCIGDAEEALRNWVEYQNQYKFKQRGIKLKYKRQCSTSWIELHLKPEEDEDEEENQNQLQLTEQSHQHQQENITAKKHKKKGNNQDKIHDHNTDKNGYNQFDVSSVDIDEADTFERIDFTPKTSNNTHKN